MKLLGPDWVDYDRKGLIKVSEARAAENLLQSLGGVREMIPYIFVPSNDGLS